MRNLFTILVVCVFFFALMIGCGGSKQTSGGDDIAPAANNTEGAAPSQDETSEKEFTVVATPPEGWEAFADSYTVVRYRESNGSGDFWVKQSPAWGTIEERISEYQERENEGGYKIEWDEVKDAEIAGMDTKYLKYTIDTDSLKMRYDAYFIQKDDALFAVICLSMPDTDYEMMEPDFKSLLDSLEIIEK